ncbi:red and blue light sensing protein [Cordyceps fumosorosea ARSEF 2679]|uniref:Red and blue light sensing protein n=1 Tax=Cordyceps fumosorosea (strain ARSEF 2679) TaxID=1081104 RepID=A0A168BS04_CORFA|nr:red and blue light sensing protein [Cordyceps fumosorosea ARSEF 2679]OAA70473.1 red and blue light sensing protein [Cordyceps fumosorosea ARSEF 2679]
MASSVPKSSTLVSNTEDCQRIHRITRENRSLWYQLRVLQQPERARACGAGMKANSDRRPVDPPPVVELRIIEGPSVETGKDITFDYNANFFLYASLEQARPMAHGRVQTPATLNPPILTGVPASGMAYLDRPNEAGYFIFPDLSVRHEGYFRLSFSLFETTKEEKDFDLEPASDMPPGVDWRMEIKTKPFNVFSAKKFPGLMESTTLSKIVADQGCRVRIRRDVRMRKRDAKPAASSDSREEAYRKPAPVPSKNNNSNPRHRSISNASEHRPHTPSFLWQRRAVATTRTAFSASNESSPDCTTATVEPHITVGRTGTATCPPVTVLSGVGPCLQEFFYASPMSVTSAIRKTGCLRTETEFQSHPAFAVLLLFHRLPFQTRLVCPYSPTYANPPPTAAFASSTVPFMWTPRHFFARVAATN